MSDPADRPFRWEDLDRRLLSPKTVGLAEEMQKRAADEERKIQFETAQSGNTAGYLPRLFDFHEQLTNEWAERLYAVHCETCRQQNCEISPAFIRAVRGHAITTMIAARKSAVLSGVVQRGARIGKRPNEFALAKWNRRMDRLALRWSQKLEAEAVACEYREAAKKLDASPQGNLQPSTPIKLSEWERITPEHLVPAVSHVRELFDTATWKCSTVTRKYCYAVLHPKEVEPSSMAPYQEAFATYRAIIGPAADKRFNDWCQVGTPPALFKAFFDALLRGIEVEVGHEFDEFLEIGRANAERLDARPVEWAKTHLKALIRAEGSAVSTWIKQVCDKQPQPLNPESDRDIDEQILWKTWRAPMFIHMQPSGNTRYDHATEWTREDEPRTQSLLNSLSNRFQQFLEIHLDQIVGNAEVKLAKNQETPVVVKPQPEHRHVRPVTQAPPPPTVLRGSSYIPRDPEPSQPLLDFPAYYPNHLKPRTSVVIGEAVRKFPVRTQVLDLLKHVISGLTTDFSTAVAKSTLRPDLALAQMGDLIHCLSVQNHDGHSDTHRLEQEARKSDEWLEFAMGIATGDPATINTREEPAAPGKEAVGASRSNLSGANTWDAIAIRFLSDERVQIRNGTTGQTLNYAEFGFEDKRNGKPTQAWALLRLLAEKDGLIRSAAEAAQPWPKVEKRIQEIRGVFRTHFRIAADPIPYIDGTGYRARFKITCRPSYNT